MKRVFGIRTNNGQTLQVEGELLCEEPTLFLHANVAHTSAYYNKWSISEETTGGVIRTFASKKEARSWAKQLTPELRRHITNAAANTLKASQLESLAEKGDGNGKQQ